MLSVIIWKKKSQIISKSRSRGGNNWVWLVIIRLMDLWCGLVSIWVLGYMGFGDVRGGVSWCIWASWKEWRGRGGGGIKYGKKKWSGEKKWWTSKSHWERQNKKVGIHVQLLDLLWIKKNKKYWSCICTKKKKEFFLRKKGFQIFMSIFWSL